MKKEVEIPFYVNNSRNCVFWGVVRTLLLLLYHICDVSEDPMQAENVVL